MKSIVSRMIFVMIGICIIGLALIIALGVVLAGSSMKSESMEKIQRSVSGEAVRIEGWFGDKISMISAMAEDIAYIEDKSAKTMEALLTAQLKTDPDCFAIYIGFPDGSATFNDGWIPDADWKSYNRGWYKGAVENKGSVYISDIYTDVQSKKYVVSISKAVTDSSGAVTGVICADIFVTVVDKIVFDINVEKGSYAFAVDGGGNILIHPDADYSPVYNESEDSDTFKNIAQVDNGIFADMWQKTQTNNSVTAKDADGVKNQYVTAMIPSANWRLYIAVPLSSVNASINRIILVLVLLSLVSIAIIIAAGIIIVRMINKILNDSAVSLQKSATDINDASHKFLENSDLLSDIGSKQISAIEQTSAAMNETAGMTQSNTNNTKQALILTNETSQSTARGKEKISSLITFMDELAESSREITNVINEISGIASQTNILALNASVESARAGEAGKAFSVVSEEVRTLAQRSNNAVETTSVIIDRNVELTRQGIVNSREIGETFEAISEKMAKVNQIVAEITAASEEQSKGVVYVNRALNDMEKLAQSNAAISQETDSAANTLKTHSEELQELTDKIKKLVGHD